MTSGTRDGDDLFVVKSSVKSLDLGQPGLGEYTVLGLKLVTTLQSRALRHLGLGPGSRKPDSTLDRD